MQRYYSNPFAASARAIGDPNTYVGQLRQYWGASAMGGPAVYVGQTTQPFTQAPVPAPQLASVWSGPFTSPHDGAHVYYLHNNPNYEYARRVRATGWANWSWRAVDPSAPPGVRSAGSWNLLCTAAPFTHVWACAPATVYPPVPPFPTLSPHPSVGQSLRGWQGSSAPTRQQSYSPAIAYSPQTLGPPPGSHTPLTLHCPPGQYWDGTQCRPVPQCPPGYYWDGTSCKQH
jgi:hypothetical protein